jgi:hypothetical protein
MPRYPALGALLAALLLVPAAGAGAQDGLPAITPVGGDAPGTLAGPLGRTALRRGWLVARDPGDRGSRRGWARGRFAGTPVEVPYVPNARTVVGAAGVRSHNGSVAWYRRELQVGRSGTYVVRFESVNHRATVWLDGRRVGGHVGTYLPFEVRVTLTAGVRHRLVVRADWRGPLRMKRAGWHRTWFNFGGINREVTVRPVDRTEIFGLTVRTRLRPDGSALVDLGAEVRNRTSVAREIAVEGALSRGSQATGVDWPAVSVPAGATRSVRTTVVVPAPELWSPGSPALYDLAVTADDAGWHQRIGLRELTWSGGRLELNGEPLVLRGASLHEEAPGRGDALSPADQQRLVDDLTWLGANATRSQHQLDPGLLERLDAAGIVVWLGIGPVDAPGAWTSKTPAMRRAARRRALRSVRQAQAHPSVIAWNLVNELAGNGHDAGQVRYLRGLQRELHRRDPGRLVALDLWGAHPPKRAGAVWRGADAVGVTNYTGWYSETRAPAAAVEREVRRDLAELRRVFPRKVLVVSEFGAEGNGRNARGRPGGLAFQAARLRAHLRAYGSTPRLSGALVWALRDFAVSPAFAGGSIRRLVPGIALVRGINQKGLFTYGGRPKPAAVAVREAFRR